MATKSPTKTAKVVTPAPLEQFAAKKIGARIVANLGAGRFSKSVTKEEYQVLADKIAIYNKKPTEQKQKAIVKLLTPEASKKKEEKEIIEVKVKAVKKQIKKAAKITKKAPSEKRNLIQEFEDLVTTDETAIPKLQAILDRFKKVEEKAPTPQVTPAPRSGEAYRNRH